MTEFLPVFETAFLNTEAKALELMNQTQEALNSVMGAPIDMLKRVGRGRYGALVTTLVLLGLAVAACSSPSQARATATEGVAAATSTLVAPASTEMPTLAPATPTVEVAPTVMADQVFIEHIAGVEPLDITLTTEWTNIFEKMPKVTEADFASGAMEETVLKAWEEQGKLTPDALKKFYAAKPGDWGSQDYLSGSQILNVRNTGNSSVELGNNSITSSLQGSAEVFNLVDVNGSTIGMVGTEMVVFENPDGSKGVMPWFYLAEKAFVGRADEPTDFEKACFGFAEPPFVSDPTDSKLWHPVPYISGDTGSFGWSDTKKWVASGEQSIQEAMLKKLIGGGYPTPEYGKQLFRLACFGSTWNGK